MTEYSSYTYSLFGKFMSGRYPAELEGFIKDQRVAQAKEQVEACQQSLNDALDNLKKTEAM